MMSDSRLGFWMTEPNTPVLPRLLVSMSLPALVTAIFGCLWLTLPSSTMTDAGRAAFTAVLAFGVVTTWGIAIAFFAENMKMRGKRQWLNDHY